MKVLVIQSCPTLCNSMDCNPPGSTVHGILQARILEWVAIPFSRDRTQVSCIAGRFFTVWATSEAHQFSSVAQSCPTLRPHGLQEARPPCPSPTPGVHSNPCPLSWYAIQLSHSLSSPSPPAPNPSQHQGLFQCVSFSHQVAKVLDFQL